jgi:hypothetical protein
MARSKNVPCESESNSRGMGGKYNTCVCNVFQPSACGGGNEPVNAMERVNVDRIAGMNARRPRSGYGAEVAGVEVFGLLAGYRCSYTPVVQIRKKALADRFPRICGRAALLICEPGGRSGNTRQYEESSERLWRRSAVGADVPQFDVYGAAACCGKFPKKRRRRLQRQVLLSSVRRQIVATHAAGISTDSSSSETSALDGEGEGAAMTKRMVLSRLRLAGNE